MELRIMGNGTLQIDDAHICFRNFEGRADTYNAAGNRNFALIIPEEELADRLVDEGWNVKIKPAQEEGDAPFIYLPVKVMFNDRGPDIYLISGENKPVRLNERTAVKLDTIEIESVSLDIRPYDWNVSGKSGRKAYLTSMEVRQRVNRFQARYAEEECPED